jgi:hypothetical protein
LIKSLLKTSVPMPTSRVTYLIDGVMVSVLAFECGRSWLRAQIGPHQTRNFVFVASSLSAQHKEKEQRLAGSGLG